MPGPKPKYGIELTTEEEQKLRKLANSRTAPYGKVIRAQILVAAYDHPEWTNQRIAQCVGCTDRSVRKWRRRWVEKRSVEDLPRPGAPRRFSPSGKSTSDSCGVQPSTRARSALGTMEQCRDRAAAGASGRSSLYCCQHSGTMAARREDQTLAVPQLAAHLGPRSLSGAGTTYPVAVRTGENVSGQRHLGGLCRREDVDPSATANASA